MSKHFFGAAIGSRRFGGRRRPDCVPIDERAPAPHRDRRRRRRCHRRGGRCRHRREEVAATGAVVGGAIGAVAGNLWSRRMEEKRAEMQRATQGTGIEVARTPDNQLKVNVPSDFSFDSGRADIKPQMRPVLDQFAQGLDPKMRVTIVGHTDSVGEDDLNNRLSLDRAPTCAITCAITASMAAA